MLVRSGSRPVWVSCLSAFACFGEVLRFALVTSRLALAPWTYECTGTYRYVGCRGETIFSRFNLSLGAESTNSRNGPIIPWLRSIDGFNTHDDSFELSISGGVTSAQVLP